jgi:6-pyruvoyltetrahydropterin/6-carboxytetrahydropterin synthase
MFRIVREVKFCFGHRLMEYEGKCRRLHGHNGRAFFSVASNELGQNGMTVDFATVKRTMKAWIDENFDHKAILHQDDPLLHRLRSLGEPAYALADHPTTENLAKALFDQARKLGVPVSEVALWENDASCAVYTADGVVSDSDDEEPTAALAARCIVPGTTMAQPTNALADSVGREFGPYFVTREIKFCFGHRLMNYNGKCRQLHGHNGRLLVTVAADELDDLGMALDFGGLKQGVQRWIDDEWDHSMILHRRDPLIPVLEEFGCTVVRLDENPTTENLAKAIHERGSAAGLNVVGVQLWETDSCAAGYAPALATTSV